MKTSPLLFFRVFLSIVLQFFLLQVCFCLQYLSAPSVFAYFSPCPFITALVSLWHHLSNRSHKHLSEFTHGPTCMYSQRHSTACLHVVLLRTTVPVLPSYTCGRLRVGDAVHTWRLIPGGHPGTNHGWQTEVSLARSSSGPLVPAPCLPVPPCPRYLAMVLGLITAPICQSPIIR